MDIKGKLHGGSFKDHKNFAILTYLFSLLRRDPAFAQYYTCFCRGLMQDTLEIKACTIHGTKGYQVNGKSPYKLEWSPYNRYITYGWYIPSKDLVMALPLYQDYCKQPIQLVFYKGTIYYLNGRAEQNILKDILNCKSTKPRFTLDLFFQALSDNTITPPKEVLW